MWNVACSVFSILKRVVAMPCTRMDVTHSPLSIQRIPGHRVADYCRCGSLTRDSLTGPLSSGFVKLPNRTGVTGWCICCTPLWP